MRWLPVVGLVLASACTPAEEGPTFGSAAPPHDPLQWLEPNYAELPEQCFTDDFYWWMKWTQGPRGIEVPPTWDHPCIQELQAHLGLDQASCDDYFYDDEVPDYTRSCGLALTGVYLLATADFGLVEDLETAPADSHADYVQAPFIDQVRQAAEVLGHDRVGPTLYDDGIPSEHMMALFVHEAAHPWLQTHHVECAEEFTPAFMGQPVPAGTVICDDDWTGAYGFHAGAAMLAYEYCPGPPYLSDHDLGNIAMGARCFINGETCPF